MTRQNAFGTKLRISSSRRTTSIRVGVWTRPTGCTLSLEILPPPSILLAARVRLRPTIQSDCERQMEEERRPAFSETSSRWSKDSLIAAGVMLVSHRRFSGNLAPARTQIIWKMSSPSRPASQALTTQPTSFRRSSFFSCWYFSPAPRSVRGRNTPLARLPSKFGGRIGRFFSVQDFQSGLSSCGSTSSAR